MKKHEIIETTYNLDNIFPDYNIIDNHGNYLSIYIETPTGFLIFPDMLKIFLLKDYLANETVCGSYGSPLLFEKNGVFFKTTYDELYTEISKRHKKYKRQQIYKKLFK